MRIEFSRNELRAAKRLTVKIAGEFDTQLSDKMGSEDIYEYLREEAFVTVLDNGSVIIDVPEELVMEYYQLSTGYITQVVNIGKMVYGLLKQFKFITKGFEREVTVMLERFIPKKEEAPQATEE